MTTKRPTWLAHGSDHKTVEDLLHQPTYTTRELAELTGVHVHVIENAVFEKELPAVVVDHDIVSIARHDAITWLVNTQG